MENTAKALDLFSREVEKATTLLKAP